MIANIFLRIQFYSCEKLLPRQFLAGAGIKIVIIDGLDADDGGDAENIVSARTAGNVSSGAIESKKDLAVGIRARYVPDQFAGDVAGVEVREDENIGFSGDGTFWQFAGRNFGNERGVHLELAVKIGMDLFFASLLFCQGGGGFNFADGRVCGAAFGGEREQRDAGADPNELARELSGGDCDVGELIDGGVGNDAAIPHEENAVFAEAAVLYFHDLTTGGSSCLGSNFYDLEERT